MKRSNDLKQPENYQIINTSPLFIKSTKPQTGLTNTPQPKENPIIFNQSESIESKENPSKSNTLISEEYRAEFDNLQKEISQLQSQIDILQEQFASLEFNNRKALTELYITDEDFQHQHSKKNKRLVRQKNLLNDLQNEYEEYKNLFSNSELYNLSVNLKKEKELYQKQQNSINYYYKKIEKTKQKLINERQNPIYSAVKEQTAKIKELEDLLSNEIIVYKHLKDIYETESKNEREKQSEIQDLTIQLETANYKLQKRQKQHMHLMKKIQKQNDSLTDINESFESNGRRRKLLIGVFHQKEIPQKVQNALLTCGEIEFIQLYSANANPPRYFAFVQFYEHKSALKALNDFNQKTVDTQFLNIRWSADQPIDSPISHPRKPKPKSSLSQKDMSNLCPVTDRILHKYHGNSRANESKNQSPRKDAAENQ